MDWGGDKSREHELSVKKYNKGKAATPDAGDAIRRPKAGQASLPTPVKPGYDATSAALVTTEA